MASPRAGSVTAERAGGSRWVRIGRSSAVSARAAGREAAEAALAGDTAGLLIVFCADSYDLEELLAAINTASGPTPLIGCSTAGEISTGGPSDASVVVVALGGAGFSVATRSAENISQDLYAAGHDVAGCAWDVEERPHKVLLLLTDGLAGDQQEIVRGAYAALGAAIPLVGGCAGDGLKMKSTFQMCGDRVIRDGAVAAAIASDGPFGIGVNHGWRKVGEPMLVTRSENNRVYMLDDRPALDAYLDRLDAPAEAREDPAAFTRFALTHPLGLQRRAGEAQVRFVAEADFADRSLGCIAQVPQGGMAWIMEGDDASVLEATDSACRSALDALAGSPPLGVVAFDCIARRGVLGDEGIGEEIGRIATHVPGTPVAGFYTYGEIARTSGVTGFHNQTLVVLAVG